MRPSLMRLAARRRVGEWRSRMPQSSYYENSHMGPALERARKQYLIPNALTGLAITGFVIAIYTYTIKVVSQDEFEDVPIPDAPQQSAQAPHTSITRQGGPTSAGAS